MKRPLVRLRHGSCRVAQAGPLPQVIAVYGEPGRSSWHRGRADLAGGGSIEADVRDLSPRSPAGNPWASVAVVIENQDWPRRDWLTLRQLRSSLERAGTTYRDSAAAEALGTPTATRDRLRNLSLALAAVAQDPAALRRLAGADTGPTLRAEDATGHPRRVSMQDLAVRLRDASRRAEAAAVEAMRPGRKPRLAVARLVLDLAADFELCSERRATATPGGPFARYVGVAVAFAAAFAGTAEPVIGDRILRDALKTYRKRYPWKTMRRNMVRKCPGKAPLRTA